MLSQSWPYTLDIETRLKVTQKLVMEKLKSIENERTKSKESETTELDSDSDDSDSCISINDSSSEEETVNTIAIRATQKKTLNQKPVFNKKNAKNFKKFQKPEMPKSFQRRNKQLQMKRKKKRFFTSK